MSHLEARFADLWVALYPNIDLVSQYRFAPPRRFRADFCAVDERIIIEVQGGIWSRRRMGHSTGAGIQRDCEKFAIAASLDYLIFPLTEGMIEEKWLNAIAKAILRRKTFKNRQSK